MRRYDMLVPAPEPALHTVSTHRQQVWLAVWTYTTPHHGRPRLHKAFRQFHFPAVPTPQTNLERNQRSLEQLQITDESIVLFDLEREDETDGFLNHKAKLP